MNLVGVAVMFWTFYKEPHCEVQSPEPEAVIAISLICQQWCDIVPVLGAHHSEFPRVVKSLDFCYCNKSCLQKENASTISPNLPEVIGQPCGHSNIDMSCLIGLW